MRGSSGWIRPIEEIDHPSCRWNKGNVYLAAGDVRKGIKLEPGDSVRFSLYVDGKGLGAEDCAPVWHQHGQATDEALCSSLAEAMCSSLTHAPPSSSTCTSSNFFANLSSVYQDDDDNSEDGEDDGNNADLSPFVSPTNPTAICLADILQPRKLPSVGSALHSEGTCQRCSFFPKNKCTNGSACEFCHLDHEKRQKRHRRKNKKAQAQTAEEGEEEEEGEEDEKLCIINLGEPMKFHPSSCSSDFKGFLSGAPGLFPGDSTPTTTADDVSADLLDLASNWDSPSINEREPCLIGGKFLAPPGLPPPGLPFLPFFALQSP